MQSNFPDLDEKRIGFEYFADADHYTVNDLEQWLPSLENLKASWLLLKSESSRAIPEQFITTLVSKGINPIVHLPLQLPDAPSAGELKAILRAYASWGVRYVILFDRPNDRGSWSSSGWSQVNLVESFLDSFIPLANECLGAGLNVVFPPLEPGGTYWDLSFLRNSLVSLQRRNQKALLSSLRLCALAQTHGRPLDWGKGGSERWSGNKPYVTPAGSQDQIGFRNFEWLQEIASSVCGHRFPLFLMGAGQSAADTVQPASITGQREIVCAVEDLLKQSADNPSDMKIVATIFGAENGSAGTCAWLRADGSLSNLASLLQKTPVSPTTSMPENGKKQGVEPVQFSSSFPISHYLLLPAYEWGVAEWHLDVIKPFVRKYQPTIGFSIAEAALAARVTVIGGEQSFSDEALADLRNHGCQVERIAGDGTTIATQLAER
jgi:hypothetical protein